MTGRMPAMLALALAAMAVCLGLAACGDSPSPAPAAATRTVEHLAGVTEVPREPRRIVTLQDQNALLPLLELGVRPIASAGLIDEDGTRSFRRTEGFDTTGIRHIGAYGEPNLEVIASLEPDLIVADEHSATGVYAQLSAIAPTVIIQVFDRPLSDALLDFAEVVGRDARARALRAAYEARIRALRAALGEDLPRTSVSLLSAGEAGSFYQSDAGGQAQYTVMRDLGLPRPAPQRPEAETDGEFSLERIAEHDADVVIVTDFSGEAADPGVAALTGSPLFRRLEAYRAGQTHVIDGTRSVGSAWARMGDFITELERILLDPGLDRDVVREAA